MKNKHKKKRIKNSFFSYEAPMNYYCPHCELQINNTAILSLTGKKFLCYLCNTIIAHRKFKMRQRRLRILPGNFENNR